MANGDGPVPAASGRALHLAGAGGRRRGVARGARRPVAPGGRARAVALPRDRPSRGRATFLAGDVEKQARTRAVLGRIHARSAASADRDLAISRLGQCGRACDDGVIDDALVHFGCLVELAAALGSRDQPEAALAVLKRAIALPVRLGDPAALADLYNGMAETRLDRGDVQAAIMYKRKCVQVHGEIALRGRIGAAFDRAGRLADGCGDGPATFFAERRA